MSPAAPQQLKADETPDQAIQISVALATYNGGRFLSEQLESLATQKYLPSELHVGDDGSVDDTIAILEDFASRAPFPVYITRNTSNLGFGENFIQIARRCECDWIAFCDQDDVWLPEKLNRCAEIIRAHDGLLLVAHNSIIANSSLVKGRLMDETSLHGLFARAKLPPGWISPGFRQIFHRDLITVIPAAYRNMLWWTGHENAHDAWTSLLASACGSVFITAEPLVLYRRHESNTTPLEQPINSQNETVRASLRDNSHIYENEAAKSLQIAKLLADLSVRSQQPFAEDMAQSAHEIAAHSELMTKRVIIYRSTGLRYRLRALTSFARAGGYNGGSRWKPGFKAFIKDACITFLRTSGQDR